MQALDPIPLDAIRAAVPRVARHALRTPLLPLPFHDGPTRIHLKLECLQPIGSFKLRGAANALALAPQGALERGVLTASAGNMAQGVAAVARALGVGCEVVIPDHAPATKRAAVERLGARLIEVTFERWWQVIEEHAYGDSDAFFLHPVCDRHVIAGNGTIGLEILEDLPEVDTIVVPYGGGGLTAGIASAVKAVRPAVRVIAAEVATAAPLTASLAAGRPVACDYHKSFVDGIGGKSVLREMWPLVSSLVDGTAVISLEQVADAIRTLVERLSVVAEGAGAAPLAAALAGHAGQGSIACVVSGGNIDPLPLSTILAGGMP